MSPSGRISHRELAAYNFLSFYADLECHAFGVMRYLNRESDRYTHVWPLV